MNQDIKELFALAGCSYVHGLKGFALFYSGDDYYMYKYEDNSIYIAVEAVNTKEIEGIFVFEIHGKRRYFFYTNQIITVREFFISLAVLNTVRKADQHLNQLLAERI